MKKEELLITIIGLKGFPIPVKKGDDLAGITCKVAEEQGTPVEGGDIIVYAQSIVSKAEGRIMDLKVIVPSEFSKNVAAQVEKDPRLVEVILRDSRSIRRTGKGHLITETHHGFVCANAGVDQSNVSNDDFVTLLPENPDRSAREIRKKIKNITGKIVGIIVSDTFGRTFREGQLNVAIGIAGLDPIRDRRGEKDLFGYVLRVKQTAIADELASAAELVMGQAAEGVPAAIIRGYEYTVKEKAGIKRIVMPRKKDLFL